jgi:UDP-N-acetylmuramoyl-tripeptide--D-alanyl-D-alanine ligase
MKKIVEKKLKILAKMILAKYRPTVVGVTGSVGKTGTKEAVYAVLSHKYRARRSIKNYNNELGVPLTIIGAEAPGHSVFGWLTVFFKALSLIVVKKKDYPEMLILEMGVDKPGDMKYLTDIVKCDVGIVTAIGPSHLEFFDSVEKIQKEKGLLVEKLNRQGWAILNYDDEKVRELRKKSYAKVLTYGFDKKADVKAQNVLFSFESNKKAADLQGISFKLNYKGSVLPARIPDVLGYSVIYSSLAAASAGLSFGMNLVDISKALGSFRAPAGRMKLIGGVKNTVIIDDTYNSSPQSCKAAFDFIKKIPLNKRARKFAVMGDMLELGKYTEQGHREVGEYLVKSGINKLVAVGERARDIVHGAREAGINSNNIYHFSDNETAGKFVQERIKEGDLIFVKGSQGARMEQIVKEIMADPGRAKELLVRQGKGWE